MPEWMLYQFAGADGAVALKVTHGNTRLSLFDATRPMASDQLIILKLVSLSSGYIRDELAYNGAYAGAACFIRLTSSFP